MAIGEDETLAAASSRAESAAMTLTEGGGERAALVAPPRHLAHFRIDRLLGQGGMGEVYLASDLALDRSVAVKLLPRAVSADAPARERFLNEARAQARLIHANVGHIYFIGEQDGQLFFAMEYIEGETLAAMLERRGRLPPTEALELVRMAALGLREAAAHGFTHRDVKPSNLLVDRHGQVKVVDFGLAVSHGDRGEGQVVGTPLYIAPEQARGETVDFRADIYALGATLHHLVAGAPPFTGDTTQALVARHLMDPRPRLPALPTGMDALIDRMMAKDPARRFASYDQLVAAIDDLSPARARVAAGPARLFAGGFDAACVVLVAGALSLLAQLGGVAVINDLQAPIFFAGLLLWSTFTPRNGVSLGKRALDLQVRPVAGSPPLTRRRLALRGLVQWGPAMLATSIGIFIEPEGMSALIEVPPVLYPLVALVWASIRRRPTPWDRVARTRVSYRQAS